MPTYNLRNGTTEIDQEDWDWITKEYGSQRINDNGYVVVQKITDGKNKIFRVHRLIMGALKGQEVDHINRIRTDNRRENLRICTVAENRRNSGHRKHNTSGYRGVNYFTNEQKRQKRWNAYIRIDGKRKNLGYFHTAIEAARKYDEMAKIHYGEFAVLNGV